MYEFLHFLFIHYYTFFFPAKSHACLRIRCVAGSDYFFIFQIYISKTKFMSSFRTLFSFGRLLLQCAVCRGRTALIATVHPSADDFDETVAYAAALIFFSVLLFLRFIVFTRK